jgi:hypothetical protein
MASSGAMKPPQDPEEDPEEQQWAALYDGPEIELTQGERADLLRALADVYHNENRVTPLLDRIGFPRGQRPGWNNTAAADMWLEVAHEFDNGIMEQPWRRLLATVFRAYRRNRTFRNLANRHLGNRPRQGSGQDQPDMHPQQTAAPDGNQDPLPALVDDRCHIVVQIDTDAETQQIADELGQRDLEPEIFWATDHGASFRVNTADPIELRRRLDATDFGYLIVPPGVPDYVYYALWVNGPDGRRFRIREAPAQQTVVNVAGEILDQYPPFRGTDRPAVIDRIGAAGQGSRLDPDGTLHDAGIQDGDELRVGFQATAGAINPQHREAALYRVRNQIVSYARAHEGFGVKVDWPQLPSEYTIEFRARSFAPDPGGGPEPVEIDRAHRVRIQLGADFPVAPPQVFWLTPIFHPNVYPMYECEAARARPNARGLVCLGELQVSFQPALDFGELCQTLVDIAGFRNYRIFQETSRVDERGNSVLITDFFDETAAQWVLAHQDRVRAIGGQFVRLGRRTKPEFRNDIEVADP